MQEKLQRFFVIPVHEAAIPERNARGDGVKIKDVDAKKSGKTLLFLTCGLW